MRAKIQQTTPLWRWCGTKNFNGLVGEKNTSSQKAKKASHDVRWGPIEKGKAENYETPPPNQPKVKDPTTLTMAIKDVPKKLKVQRSKIRANRQDSVPASQRKLPHQLGVRVEVEYRQKSERQLYRLQDLSRFLPRRRREIGDSQKTGPTPHLFVRRLGSCSRETTQKPKETTIWERGRGRSLVLRHSNLVRFVDFGRTKEPRDVDPLVHSIVEVRRCAGIHRNCNSRAQGKQASDEGAKKQRDAPLQETYGQVGVSLFEGTPFWLCSQGKPKRTTTHVGSRWER